MPTWFPGPGIWESDLDLLRHSKILQCDAQSIKPSRPPHWGAHTHKATLKGLWWFTITSRGALSCVTIAATVSDTCVSGIQWSTGWKSSYNFMITHPVVHWYASVTLNSSQQKLFAESFSKCVLSAQHWTLYWWLRIKIFATKSS